jgi:hypothetical protein
MPYRTLLAFATAALATGALIGLALSGLTTSSAVQNPTISLDMVTAGNTYSDPGTGGDNSMQVGTIDSTSTGCPGNNLTHTHTVHLVINNVEDLVGWQTRMNYDGGKMRPSSINFAPFMDTNTGQFVSFVNLPIDSATGTHRDAPGSTSIPPAAAGPQTAIVGASYQGVQNFAISPDTPPKSPPDNSSYSAPTGGVLAALNLQVLAGNNGQALSMDLDDGNPNTPGSGIAFFDGTTSQEILLSESALGDGAHQEGIGCPSATPTVSPAPPTATPTATPTTTPTAPPLGNLRLSLDMDPAGNSYSDPGAGGDNSMSVGTVDQCLSTTSPGNNASHIHSVQVVVQNVRDLIGWQARVNYDGGRMRPTTVNFSPFTDTATGQNVSFVNLPVDSALGAHRNLSFASGIPPAAPGPQSAAFGSSYLGAQNFPISPDTPPKSPADDSSYRALFGGVLATVNLQVLAGNAGQQSLLMNMDDGSPNAPGSGLAVFDGTGSQTIDLTPQDLGDGYHGEGANCVPLNCVTQECPGAVTPTPSPTPSSGGCPTPAPTDFCSPTPTPTRTPSPTPATPTATCTCTASATPTATPSVTPPSGAAHDSRLSRISGVTKNARLGRFGAVNDTASITVANQSGHSDTIGVYVDLMAPAAGGCLPNGRVLQTTVVVAAGAKTTVSVPVTYRCSDPSAANGLSYTWVAVADHNADDVSSCPPGSLQGVTCFNALADDDQDPADNRVSRNGPRVIWQ